MPERVAIAGLQGQCVTPKGVELVLVEAKDAVTLRSGLHDDLGMDEVDLIEVVFRGSALFCRTMASSYRPP